MKNAVRDAFWDANESTQSNEDRKKKWSIPNWSFCRYMLLLNSSNLVGSTVKRKFLSGWLANAVFAVAATGATLLANIKTEEAGTSPPSGGELSAVGSCHTVRVWENISLARKQATSYKR